MEVIVWLLTSAVYIIYAFSSVAPTINDIKGWAIIIVIATGMILGIFLVAEILFYAITRKQPTMDDEMDKMVGYRATRIGFAVVVIGLAAAIITLACGGIGFTAIQIVWGSLVGGCVIDGILRIYFYEKGVKQI
jgi:uncharacterized membrane protein